jgi:hypothetical protein
MANILDKYGIKEVADVMFYEIDPSTGEASKPVLYLDTLKVSTIEQTAEEAIAKGGKGNAPLITWDYGKDINVTLEDALFSAKSMAIMFGNSTVDTTMSALKKTVAWRAAASTTLASAQPTKFEGPQGKEYEIKAAYNPVTYNATGASVTDNVEAGQTYYTTFDMPIVGAYTIDISANSFPGTYYVTGDTYARSEISGNDEFFQFIIPKAKVKSENTITLEAEGDPSVFNLSLHVLRPAGGGAMMKLVKYDMDEITG